MHLAVTVVAVAASFAQPAPAAGLDLGNAAGYGIAFAGRGSSLKINNGPIVGNPLVGDGTTVTTSGGGNGQVIGTIITDGSVPQRAFSGLQTPPGAGQFNPVTPSCVSDAVASAATVSAYAAGLSANQTFTNTTTATTFDRTIGSGVYVIDVNKIQNADLTLKGGADDFFEVNVSQNFRTNQQITLDGVAASNVLFNFTASSGNVLQTSGGNELSGTFLATNGGNLQVSELDLTGSLINTAGLIEFVSVSHLTEAAPVPVPKPSIWVMLWAGVGLAYLRPGPCSGRGSARYMSWVAASDTTSVSCP